MGSQRRPCVLVVEDEFLVRIMIVEELTQAGFDVLEAGSSEDALALLPTSGPIDLLFTDIRLPGINGWELAQRIRGQFAEVPVIYASGYSDQADPLPHSKFLHKPYRPSQVLQAARNLGIKLPNDLPN